MKKFNIFVIWALLVVACGGGDDVTAKKDLISVSPNFELLGDGEAKELDITATCDWRITKEANADWLTVNPMSGDKYTKPIVSASKNLTGVARSTILTISGGDAITQRVEVTQTKSSDNQDPTSSGEPSADDNLPPT